ncbi:19882_t:CDS:2, partial [Racocetra persica]
LNCLGVELTENELREMANLVLKKTVNLKDPIFQEEDIVPHETSSNISSDTNDNNGKSSSSMDFNPENLVDAILNE